MNLLVQNSNGGHSLMIMGQMPTKANSQLVVDCTSNKMNLHQSLSDIYFEFLFSFISLNFII